MGNGTRDGCLGHTIRTYWPDDTDKEIYIVSSTSPTLQDLLDRAREKWPDSNAVDIEISSEEIQTDCLGYDCYDPIDYTDFIILKIK